MVGYSMVQQQISNRPVENLILTGLPATEYDRLIPNLELVDLPQGRIIYHPGEAIHKVYFPNSGMVSLLSTTSGAETIEIAMVGNEGMIGMPVVWGSKITPYQVGIQIASSALVLKASLLKDELKRQT